jgi:hypothetical protein
MTRPTTADLREVLLTVVKEQEQALQRGGSLQQPLILNEVGRRLGISHTPDQHVAILTLWNDLFRTGYLGWGLDLNNPNPPFFHVTERGQRTLERLSRDPGNPAGYQRHLSSVAALNPIAQSYLSEALDCFAGGLYRGAAVMLGCAAESLLIELRDVTVSRLGGQGVTIPKGLGDWKIKTVLDALYSILGSRVRQMPKDLGDDFGAFWPALTHQVRTVRNDAGHPVRVDSLTTENVHASFLLFPDLARMASRLNAWVAAELQ